VFVARAKAFRSNIFVCSKGKTVNAKSIVSVAGLGIRAGTRILIKAEGEDEEEAVRTLISLVDSGFAGK